ncbi:hypothetical protein QQ045_016893 [Rhodiola kirilowii]
MVKNRGGAFKGIAVARGALKITHLFFADDCMIYLRANVTDFAAIKSILENYEAVAGQRINYSKSKVFFSPNVEDRDREALSNLLGVSKVPGHSKYLGLPLDMGQKRSKAFNFVVDKMWSKINGWKENLLSITGKEVLIKSVLMATPLYTMSCFSLPLGILKKLTSVVAKFWWSKQGISSGVYWVRRELMEEAKSCGGLSWDAQEGKFSWNKCSLGIYSTRSGYGVAKAINTAGEGQPSDYRKIKSFWNHLWGIHAPMKVLLLLWRLHHNAWPVAQVLASRGISVEVSCKICGHHQKSITHLLSRCWWSKALWNHLGIQFSVEGLLANSTDWLWRITLTREDEELLRIAAGVWIIWRHRNEVWHGEEWDVRWAARRVELYCRLWRRMSWATLVWLEMRWELWWLHLLVGRARCAGNWRRKGWLLFRLWKLQMLGIGKT